MPEISVKDHTIYFEEHGQGDPLLLISGLGTSCLTWWKQIAPLGQHYRVITIDNRGIGNSSRVSQLFTISDMAEDMAALIRALNLGSCNVLGVSMGGFIALTLCTLHPELVRKLILVSTSAGGKKHVPSEQRIIDIILKGNQSDAETHCRTLYPALAGAGYMQSHPEDLDHIVANAMEKPLAPDTYLYQLTAIGEYTAAGVSLDKIYAPTMVIHGDADALVPHANGQYLADHIKGAKILTYAGCGHLLPIEAADRLNQDVIAFLG